MVPDQGNVQNSQDREVAVQKEEEWLSHFLPLSFPYSCKILITAHGHFETQRTGYFSALFSISLLKCFSFDPLLCGNWLFCSINSLIQSIYDLKVKFILIPTTIAIPFPPLFDSKRESVCVIWCKTVQTVQWAADFCPSRRLKAFPTLTLHLLCDFLDLSFFFFKIKWWRQK